MPCFLSICSYSIYIPYWGILNKGAKKKERLYITKLRHVSVIAHCSIIVDEHLHSVRIRRCFQSTAIIARHLAAFEITCQQFYIITEDLVNGNYIITRRCNYTRQEQEL